MLLYGNDTVSLPASEDELQIMTHQLNVTADKYKTKISTTNTKPVGVAITFKRVKIMLDNKIIKHISEFNYTGYFISDHRMDMGIKLLSYKINDIINKTSANKCYKKKIRINIAARATLKAW
jgi:hypothetical protein